MTQKQIALTLGLGLGAILLTTAQMHGQDNGDGSCGDHTQIVRQLGEKYGETRRLIALTQARQVVELFASSETGTWTLLITFPTGESCLISAGDMIELVPDTTLKGDPA